MTTQKINFSLVPIGGHEVGLIHGDNVSASCPKGFSSELPNFLLALSQSLEERMPQYLCYLDSEGYWDQIIHDEGAFKRFSKLENLTANSSSNEVAEAVLLQSLDSFKA